MADFLRRLAERALGVANVAQPAIAPRFALGPRLADEFSATPAEAPRVPNHRGLSHEPPRSWRSPDIEAHQREVDIPKRPVRLDEQPSAPLPVHVETEPAIPVNDLTRRALKAAVRTETPESGVQEVEPRRQPAIAPSSARPEPRVEAFAEERESRPPTVEPQARKDLEVLKWGPKEQAALEQDVPHPTMPAIPWRDGHSTANGMPSSRAEEHEDSAPIVRVSIGRVEVRAVFPDPPPRQSAPLPRSSALTLSEYLKQRDGGMR
jgi:hypothetical protein